MTKTISHSLEAEQPSIVPKVSIGLPVYNGLPYLQETLDSILSQTFEDFEEIDRIVSYVEET